MKQEKLNLKKRHYEKFKICDHSAGWDSVTLIDHYHDEFYCEEICRKCGKPRWEVEAEMEGGDPYE